MDRLTLAAFVLGFMIAAPQAATEAAAADTAAGETVAHTICASCHDVSGAKPRRERARLPAVPPAFYAVAQDPAHTNAWFRRFLRMPHGDMDNVMLTQSDIDNVSAYILAMRNSNP